MFQRNSLGSDNHSGVHPQIFSALAKVNSGHAAAYGTDDFTTQVLKEIGQQFGSNAHPFLVFNGTAANVLCLTALTESFQAIITAETSHLHVDECGAPEHAIGCKLLTIPTIDGKITPDQISEFLIRGGDQHYSQPKVVSITQPTEYGTLYSYDELKALRDFTKKHNLYLHIDGARFIYAAAGLNKSLKELTGDLEIDALSFGGTKNGLLFGELVVLFDKELAQKMKYIRKQNMQLPSKARFLASQFDVFFKKDLWREIAIHNHQMAKHLENRLRALPQVKITQKVEANAVFAIFPKAIIKELRESFFFYIWNETTFEARLMVSFDVTIGDIDQFADRVQTLVQEKT